MSNPRLPNLCLIMTDTMGADMAGAFDARRALRSFTPNIDALARRGAAFQRAYTSSPLCTPARAGLFTGIASQRSGGWTNSIPLGAGVRHMGQYFQALGYRTAYIGKWHLDAHDYFGTGRCPDGFESPWWYDGRNYLDDLTPEQRDFWRAKTAPDDFRAFGVTDGFTWAKRINQRARAFLDSCQGDDRPFLLILSYDEPHHPFTCPYEDIAAVADVVIDNGPSWDEDLSRKPAHYQRWSEHGWGGRTKTFNNRSYLGCCHFVDRMVGEAVAMIDGMGRDDTYLAYTSDHGDMHLAHGGLAAKGPSALDEIARIPLSLCGPGIAPGMRPTTAVSHLDVLPTFLGLAGGTCPAALDGGDLLPIAQGREDAAREVIVEYHRYELVHDGYMDWCPMRALVGRDWKLTLHERYGDELYHCPSDPHEVANRIRDPAAAEVRDAMHDRLLRWMQLRNDPLRGSAWRQRAWRDLGAVPFKSTSRGVADDGVRPTYLDYDTAKPARGELIQYS